MLIIGLDIGTTTVCATLVDSKNGEVKDVITEKNGAFIKTKYPWQKQQDPQIIFDTAQGLVKRLAEKYAPIGGIGVTGQSVSLA